MVKNAYFTDAVYRLRAELLSDGTASFEVFDWKGSRLWQGDSTQKYETVPAVFELWLFILDKNTFSTRKSTVTEVRAWLKLTGGVHIYEDGIRVAPYGGADADWLEINLMRVRSPEERPSTNNTIGRMTIINNDGRLQQKTDRNGYIENEDFFELKRFGQDALKWLAHKRMALAETRRDHEKKQSSAESKKAIDVLDKALEKAVKDPKAKKDIERAVAKAFTTTEREKKALRDDLQLYRSLATAGMTSAVFSHQISQPIGHVDKLLGKIEKKVPAPVKTEIGSLIALLRKAKEKLLAYTRLPLKLLRSEKRRVGSLDLHRIIQGISNDYRPVLDFGNIRLKLQFAAGVPSCLGSIALIEGILANFFANSVKAFDRGGTPSTERLITIQTEYGDDCLQVTFADSGSGIVDIAIEDIWLPGKTTDKSDLGTGFGLTIVRDSVKDLGGTVWAKQKGNLGGAEFTVLIPLVSGGA
ncbi:MAG TPA: HAMP domain-containing histidine kinase [Nitrospirae bacterium]|nr:HAMP domain-containing histidine kinase [Nitrospirota bacterium]